MLRRRDASTQQRNSSQRVRAHAATAALDGGARAPRVRGLLLPDMTTSQAASWTSAGASTEVLRPGRGAGSQPAISDRYLRYSRAEQRGDTRYKQTRGDHRGNVIMQQTRDRLTMARYATPRGDERCQAPPEMIDMLRISSPPCWLQKGGPSEALMGLQAWPAASGRGSASSPRCSAEALPR